MLLVPVVSSVATMAGVFPAGGTVMETMTVGMDLMNLLTVTVSYTQPLTFP